MNSWGWFRTRTCCGDAWVAIHERGFGSEGSVKVSERRVQLRAVPRSGGEHMLAMEGHLADPAIGRPRLASAAALNGLCGQCHGARVGIGHNDPEMARFQATALPMSRCSSASLEPMSCLVCHDPHRNARTSPAYYESRCLDCHAPGKSPPPKDDPEGPTPRLACPVNPAHDCLSCHMPKVKTSVPNTTFTDHFIRVRRD